jgi:hypothetical protein
MYNMDNLIISLTDEFRVLLLYIRTIEKISYVLPKLWYFNRY